jgi:hypothetical protein
MTHVRLQHFWNAVFCRVVPRGGPGATDTAHPAGAAHRSCDAGDLRMVRDWPVHRDGFSGRPGAPPRTIWCRFGPEIVGLVRIVRGRIGGGNARGRMSLKDFSKYPLTKTL